MTEGDGRNAQWRAVPLRVGTRGARVLPWLLLGVGACAGAIEDASLEEGTTPAAPGPARTTGGGGPGPRPDPAPSAPKAASPGCAAVASDPGRPTVRRLNHTQYDWTLRDLLGITSSFERHLVADSDGSADGFDANGETLKGLDWTRLTGLFDAAEAAVAEALSRPGTGLLRCATTIADASCRREILAGFATRAYRRPLEPEEVARLAAFTERARTEEKLSDLDALSVGMSAVLMSPHFLYLLAAEPAPADPTSIYTLNDHELAARLSYLLWNSMPDAELFARAATPGELRRPEVLRAQIERMLRDPKAARFAESFAGQWLMLRTFLTPEVSPDPAVFPNFSRRSLRGAMARETELLFRAVVTADRSPLELLTADYTFVNANLATHYGLSGVTGDGMQRVSLAGRPRKGILTHGSVLTVTSSPDRTNVPKRGNWILERLACVSVPEPDPDLMIEELPPSNGGTLSMRERLKAHREKPECRGCHALIDPIGLGLENFDGVGTWRTRDGQAPIDPSGELFGLSFKTHLDLISLLADRPEFGHCFSEKLLAYAIGRSLDRNAGSADLCLVERLSEHVRPGARFSDLVTAIALSDPFGKQRGERP